MILKFAKAYIKSMRLYYSFVTGIAGWLGVSFYVHIARNYQTVEIEPGPLKQAVILAVLFLSWGINQIINDYLGLEEDRVNAPQRPMVTGELHPETAVAVSALLMAGSAVYTWFFLSPLAVIPLLLGVFINILYEYAKGWGIWGNIVFGLMITMCCAYGFLASGPTTSPYFTKSRITVLLVVWLLNGLMTFFTYFKDYRGDRAANKQTLVVKYGLKKARRMALLAPFLPTALFLGLYYGGQIEALMNNVFIILGLFTIFIQAWTSVLYYRNPIGKSTYFSLATNFRACVCGQATFIALFNTELALVLFLFSYIFIGFLFDLHGNHQA